MKLTSLNQLTCLAAVLIFTQFLTAFASAQTTTYKISDRWKNKYLCDTGASVAYQTTADTTNCQWTMIDVAGFKSFKNLATNDFMHIENLTGTVQAASGDSSWLSANWSVETVDATYVWIKNRWQTMQYIHVENQTGFAQSGAAIDKAWWSAQWKIAAVPSATYQAENNFFSGSVTNAGSYLQNFSAPGARVIFTVNSNAAATYGVSLNFANPSGTAKTLNIYVNGLWVKTTTLNPTGGATIWAGQVEQLSLRAGLNTIMYKYDAANTGGVNVDSVAVPNASALAVRGATLPYQELEAEAGVTNGQISGVSTAYLTVESESSGRRFVNLSATGQYVQWTSAKAANALTLRYNMPDAGAGGGINGTLSLYVNGTKVKTLNLTSRFAWTYGAFPFNDNPGNGSGHHFYDEVHLAGLNIPAGATVKLQKDSGDAAAYYKIDLIDLEQIESAYSMPANFVSITSYGGAIANDGYDDTIAINNTINYAKSVGMGVWIPAGTFNINAKLNNISNMHIRGAGMWYSLLQGSNGQGGFYVTGGNTTIADLALASDSIQRNDSADAAAFEGNFGTGSLVQNVWVEHMKVGFWPIAGTDGLFIVNGRIRDTWADGLNFYGGVINSQISHFSVRNTGDDCLAMWSSGAAGVNNSFRFNTAQVPNLANIFAIYGGTSNKVLDNIGSDTVVSSAGIAVSTRFSPVSFAGTTEIKRNTLNRTGGFDQAWNTTFGALWIYAENQDITAPIVVDNLALNNSTYDGILMSYNHRISNINFNNVQINGAGSYGIDILSMTGAGYFSNVTVTNAALGGLNNSSTLVITKGSGNSGW